MAFVIKTDYKLIKGARTKKKINSGDSIAWTGTDKIGVIIHVDFKDERLQRCTNLCMDNVQMFLIL